MAPRTNLCGAIVFVRFHRHTVRHPAPECAAVEGYIRSTPGTSRPPVRWPAMRSFAFMVTLLATTLALGAGLAHSYELPAKMALSEEEYFTVQQIYRGWSNIAFTLLVEMTGLIALLIVYWKFPRIRAPLIAALAAFLASQALFWVFTFPANLATENWTVSPDNWRDLRRQWEYSHLGGAAFQLIALMALAWALLRKGETQDAPRHGKFAAQDC